MIDELLRALSEDYGSGRFAPILEADIVGYLYHLLVSKHGNAGEVHINTRICGLVDKKFDLVVGGVSYRAKRPCIAKPRLVVEVKSFPRGFTSSQCERRYRAVIGNDLPKLAKLEEPLDGRCALLFDEENYLIGFDSLRCSSRIRGIVEHRNNLDSRIKIIYMRRAGKTLEWSLL